MLKESSTIVSMVSTITLVLWLLMDCALEFFTHTKNATCRVNMKIMVLNIFKLSLPVVVIEYSKRHYYAYKHE